MHRDDLHSTSNNGRENQPENNGCENQPDVKAKTNEFFSPPKKKQPGATHLIGMTRAALLHTTALGSSAPVVPLSPISDGDRPMSSLSEPGLNQDTPSLEEEVNHLIASRSRGGKPRRRGATHFQGGFAKNSNEDVNPETLA